MAALVRVQYPNQSVNRRGVATYRGVNRFGTLDTNGSCRCAYPYARKTLGGARVGLSGLSGTGAGAAQGAASGAAAGAVAGPIGAVVGGVIGAVAGLFGSGANKAQIAVDVTGRQKLFDQYATVAGTIPGRQIGLTTMRDVWKGAAHENHFPAWQGQEQRIDYAIDGCNKCDPNTFNILWPKAAASGVTDAKTFVDNYVWPANASMGDHWLTNTDSIGRQIVYDAADAYISGKIPNSIAYAPNAPPPVATAAPPPSPAPVIVSAPSVAQPTAVALSAPMQIAVPSTQVITTPQGAFQFGAPYGQGHGTDQWILVNGQPNGAGNILQWDGQNMRLQAFDASVWIYQNGTWVRVNVPASTTATAPVPTVTTQPVTTPTATTDPQTQALIQQLLAQGATQQQAFQAALSQLQAQGVQPTAQVQQAVASDVANATPQTASLLSGNTGAIVIGVVLLGLGVSMFKRSKKA
jgi:hypothetical protein